VEKIGVKFMAENESTKVCRLCAEKIKAAAKLCPYCRTSQRRWPFFTVFDLTLIITLLLFIGSWALIIHLLNHGRTFSPKRDRIEVLSSKLALDVTKHSTNVIVVGVLTNGSPYTWIIRDMEIRFLDRDGKTIDADEIWGDFTVLPHDDHSFRSQIYGRKSVPEHASCKIHVRLARDPKAP